MTRFIFALVLLLTTAYGQEITTKLVRGKDISTYVKPITDLSLIVYREYPYLYEGTEEEYSPYIETYADSEKGIAVLLLDGEKPVGALTGIPIGELSGHYTDPFSKNGYQLPSLYYIGETIILPQYRGKGFGTKMYEMAEAEIKSMHYPTITLCQVSEPAKSSLKPTPYYPAANFWAKRGFVEQKNLFIETRWMDVESGKLATHHLIFWNKKLSEQRSSK